MPKQKKKTPLRKCVVTQEMKPKQQLIRVVRNKEGEVFVDPTGKKNGRGAYISKDLNVINTAEEQGMLARHLNTGIDSAVFEQLRAQVTEIE
ncbi:MULTISPECIES: RNase P modulator RnpM [Salimicrobium]|uniref:RNA-binding protein n=1 Tax=Salimicrobium humidisoli TaxID=2029857 RepID=A0ABX4HRQ3_9BACI|nr:MULTISPECIES: YlxR family protein [Salimicrobium]PBB05902.1 RNA-binding protein [Salimicrobium humidisoli]